MMWTIKLAVCYEHRNFRRVLLNISPNLYDYFHIYLVYLWNLEDWCYHCANKIIIQDKLRNTYRYLRHKKPISGVDLYFYELRLLRFNLLLVGI